MKFKYLTLIAFLCFGLVIWINFIDFKLPEIIPGKGIKFEILIEGFSKAFIASYIFYTVNIYLREKREKKFILPLIANNVMLLIVNNHSIINCLKNDSKLSLDYFPTKDEFNDLLRLVNPRSNSPLYYKDKSWTFLFQNRQKSTLSGISKIFASGKHLDEELRTILLQMQSSLYLQDNYAFNSDAFEEKNLSKYYVVFFTYFELVKRLKSYYDKNLKTFYETYRQKVA
ncbi:MAG: hypothetical protein V4620_04485 [Bacteroidota bacterium]